MNEKFTIKPAPESAPTPHLPALFAFECVARHMNFARAAEEMGVTPTAISRTIRVLEEQMQVRLFNRTTRSVALTEAGAQLMQSLSPALAAIRDSVAHAGATSERPSGKLRINASHVAYSVLIKPRLQGFLQTFPEITLDLALDNRLSDVTGAGFDAGIRLGHALHRDMIAVRLGRPQRRTVVASPAYLATHGEPRKPEDLLSHSCIRQRFPASERFFEWKFARSVQIDVQGQLVFDEMRAVVEAAAAGLGIGYVFEEFAAQEVAAGVLQPVLEKYRLPGESFYLYYPNRSHMPGKLRAFIDYLR
jgi:DNA-binding transcriptional LysR family regulator